MHAVFFVNALYIYIDSEQYMYYVAVYDTCELLYATVSSININAQYIAKLTSV